MRGVGGYEVELYSLTPSLGLSLGLSLYLNSLSRLQPQPPNPGFVFGERRGRSRQRVGVKSETENLEGDQGQDWG